ncbi:hypothetical protein SCUCBS95973_005929 [Sporothrix curviconia]|uniref:Zn(2)-C6 fungal-type domain-containing protein n=1 Tax=Sporothrix curviconia TaxID=1260050 RepID=A0ABP0C0W0_9PEZI
MQTPAQGMTQAQANAVRSTCTACHQRKVKCDAHDRGYPCSRCVKSGSGSDCRLHRKNKRVSRARQALAQQAKEEHGLLLQQLQSKPETPSRAKRLSPAAIQPSPAVEDTIVALAEAETRTPAAAAAAAVATPGSLFLQTVIANDAGRNASFPVDEGDADADSDVDDESITQQHHDGPRTPAEAHHAFSDAGMTGGGTAGSTAASVTTASTPAVLPTHGTDGEYKKYLVEFIDQPQLAERPIDKTARILYVGSPLSNMHFLLRQRMARAGEQPPMDVVHYPTNRIAKPSAGLGGLAADGLPLEAFQLPPKRTVDQLLAAYLQHINPGFPVVDGRLLMRQYRARDPQNPPSLLLLQAILVAGAHVYYKDPDERAVHKALFFRRSKMLLDARVERNRDTVVQAALLLTWHADGPEDVAANAWHWVGLAARTATGLGMHRDAEASTLVPHNKRMWRRVWWLLVASDVLVALQYGRPPALHLDDTDVQPPTAADFADCGAGTRVDYVLHLVQLCILLSTHVLRRQFKASRAAAAAAAANKSAAAVAAAAAASLRRTDEALANWYLHLSPSLQLGGHSIGDCRSSSSSSTLSSSLLPSSSETAPSSSINVWTAFLHLTYNTALLLLHRQAPLPSTSSMAGSSSSSSSSSTGIPAASGDDVEICTNAAVAIQQICQAVCASGQAVYLWSSAINSLFTALIQLSGDVQRSTISSSLSSSSTADSKTGNPLLAVAALRRYDGALSSLRQLAVYWPNAQAVVQFFEQSVRTAPLGSTASTTTMDSSTSSTDSTDSTRATTPLPTLSTLPPLPLVTAVLPSEHASKDVGIYSHHHHAVMVPMDGVEAADDDSTVAQVHHHGHMQQQQHDLADASDPDEMAHHLLSGLVAASRQMMPYDGSDGGPAQQQQQQQHLADPWGAGSAGVFATDWQRIYWQQPELTDDFLFNF